jgi:beta-lactamase regulating signal transducer with metallopeptidase domain
VRPAESSTTPAAPSSPAARSPEPVSPDLIVSIIWLATSTATAVWHLLGAIALARLVRHAPRATILGVSVRKTTAGPAVFGVFRPAIFWPRWLDEAPAATQAAAIAHETQHLAAGDPLLLAAGLAVVVLAPWNPALWWQLQRMRFAMEADCDQRVVRAGSEENAYAQALLQIAQARAAGWAGPGLLMSAPSWLEQRIRILLRPPGRRRVPMAALGATLALGALVAVAQLPAPTLRGTDLRKLPPEDIRPGADWARTIARARYPELFDRHFDGTAVVAAIFNGDGTPRLVDEHLFGPGVPPSDLDLAIENQRASVDLLNDVYYAGQEHNPYTIGPWLDTVNAGRVLVVYEVLGREPDPSRSAGRAEAALRAYAPELFIARNGEAHEQHYVTLLMNDDGTVARMSKARFSGWPYAVERFAAMGIPQERLGRGGRFGAGNVLVDYAWPRRPDDPPDMWGPYGFLFPDGQPLPAPSARDDPDDDARIEERYFREVGQNGPEAFTELVGGQKTYITPWVLYGRDGRVWDTGFWHSYADQPHVGYNQALYEEIEDRFPGIRVDPGLSVGGIAGMSIAGMSLATAWIAADSPLQRKADVDLQKRKHFLVTGALTAAVSATAVRLWMPMVAAADLDVPAEMSLGLGWPLDLDRLNAPLYQLGTPAPRPRVEVTVTQASQKSMTLNVRALPLWRTSHPGIWTAIVRVEAPYGQTTTVEFPDHTPDQTMRLLLRVERLKR